MEVTEALAVQVPQLCLALVEFSKVSLRLWVRRGRRGEERRGEGKGEGRGDRGEERGEGGEERIRFLKLAEHAFRKLPL